MTTADLIISHVCAFTVGACIGVMAFTAILLVAFKKGLVPDRAPHEQPSDDLPLRFRKWDGQ